MRAPPYSKLHSYRTMSSSILTVPTSTTIKDRHFKYRRRSYIDGTVLPVPEINLKSMCTIVTRIIQPDLGLFSPHANRWGAMYTVSIASKPQDLFSITGML